MKLLACVILLCFAVATYAVPRIIGGKDAPEGVYKYQVSLRSSGRHICGGSIISKRWILTAAHCVHRSADKSITVVAGTNLIHGGEEQAYQSDYIACHPSFSLFMARNDIALIHVSKDIEFNDKVQPVALPKEEFYQVGDVATLTGWGSTTLGGATPDKLQEIELKIYDQAACKRAVAHIAKVTDAHICTFTKSGEGACHGDSGGPLVANGVQVGVVSFGHPCAAGRPDVFTRVYSFLDWIAAKQAKF